jgi:hypothetical protein
MKKRVAVLALAAAVLVAPAGLAGAAETPKAPDGATGAAGRDARDVLDTVVDAASRKIDAAVADGRLDEARAKQIKERLARFAARVSARPDGERMRHRRPGAAIRRHLRRAAIGIAAEAIGVEPGELREARRNGQSIADVARANDVDPQTVIDAVVDAAGEKIDTAVANDRIDESRAATIKERLGERVTTLVHATRRGAST